MSQAISLSTDEAVIMGRQLLDEVNQMGEQFVHQCGERFKKIRDEELYPTNIKWIDFCLEHCSWKRTRVLQAIYYVETVAELEKVTMVTLPSERTIRPLLKLESAEDKREVWAEVSGNGGRITAEKVERAVERHIMNSGHTKTKQGRPTKIAFNPTSDKVDWAKWTWNPVVGCKHGCTYCYARDFAKRQGYCFEKPELKMHRLAAPKNSGIPQGMEKEPGIRNVFVVSMGDLFGEWVPDDWIAKVLNAVRDNPQWTYIFLTKNPARLAEIEWPPHCWVGTTIDIQARVTPAEEAFAHVRADVRFISAEPLMADLHFNHLDRFDWVIIGGRSRSSGMKEGQPSWKWVHNLEHQAIAAGCKVYHKPNLTVRPKEYPDEEAQ